jgi:hypothetical protein
MILDGPGAMGGGQQIVNGVLTTCWQCDTNGNFQFGPGGTAPSATLAIARAAVATPAATRQLQVTDAADTARAASTEYHTFFSQSNLIRTWATGALALQRENRFDGGALAFVGASTVAQAATVGIGTQPTAGTNATLTDAYGLLLAANVRAGFGGALVGNLSALQLGLLAFSWVATGDANATLTATQCANPIIVCSGATLTATRNLIVVNPNAAGGIYCIKNSTGGAQSIQIIGTSGTGITIATGKTALVFWDGTNFQRMTADV